MRQKSLMNLEAGGKAVTRRPPSPAAVAFSKVLSRTWSLPRPRNQVMTERDVRVPSLRSRKSHVCTVMS